MRDAFDLLGVEPRFDLDGADLRDRLLTLAAANHPDRHTDPFDQAEAADQLSRVNEAYRTLADPERRANALLARLGGPSKADDKSLPPGLLLEVMEVREELEQAVAAEDHAAIARLRKWATDQRAQRLDSVAKLFATATADPAALVQAVRLELNAWRYFERMLDQMPG